MAIPTLTACTPGTLFTGGQLVTLTGTNFRTAYAVPNNGIVPVPPPTVSVKFGGVPATRVCVFSATELTCIAPAHDPGGAAIEVRNLDVNGNPISGEVVTTSSAVTYSRVNLATRDDFTRLTDALVSMLRRQVIENVVVTKGVDYSDRAGELSFELVDIGSLPVVVVAPPTYKTNRAYDLDPIPERSTGSTTFEQRRLMKVVSVTWKISVYDDSQLRSNNMMGLITKVFSLNPWLYVDIDQTDSAQGTAKYELIAGDFGATGAASNSDVRSFAGEVVLHGFKFEDLAGMSGTMLSRKGGTADTLQLSIAHETHEV